MFKKIAIILFALAATPAQELKPMYSFFSSCANACMRQLSRVTTYATTTMSLPQKIWYARHIKQYKNEKNYDALIKTAQQFLAVLEPEINAIDLDATTRQEAQEAIADIRNAHNVDSFLNTQSRAELAYAGIRTLVEIIAQNCTAPAARAPIVDTTKPVVLPVIEKPVQPVKRQKTATKVPAITTEESDSDSDSDSEFKDPINTNDSVAPTSTTTKTSDRQIADQKPQPVTTAQNNNESDELPEFDFSFPAATTATKTSDRQIADQKPQPVTTAQNNNSDSQNDNELPEFDFSFPAPTSTTTTQAAQPVTTAQNNNSDSQNESEIVIDQETLKAFKIAPYENDSDSDRTSSSDEEDTITTTQTSDRQIAAQMPQPKTKLQECFVLLDILNEPTSTQNNVEEKNQIERKRKRQ